MKERLRRPASSDGVSHTVAALLGRRPAALGAGRTPPPASSPRSLCQESRDNRKRYLQLYQRVLDFQPPREVQAQIRLDMGHALYGGFSESLPEVAIPWYAQTINDFPELRADRSMIVTRLCLASMLARQYPEQFGAEVDLLYREALAVPPKQIVLNGPDQRLNMNAIGPAVTPSLADMPPEVGTAMADRLNAEHRQSLPKQRQEIITQLRRDAAESWLRAGLKPQDPAANRQRIQAIRSEYPYDPAVQKAADDVLQGLGDSP